ncbi:hypothetical protein METBIDRAFT_30541 [Metschnikowia bicuspidata var. bicuspidata NRRL YB-4993]|uniref:N-acetyltransferase domain-containing protein n=1 Tax=Metschnikowia bicuspidata var. bicuspidata NRRL YB-4993 TaxID=869754 RepID=A0A1A0HJ81_9ASCO|nr:hypothetical protein METBIDRAFT_30541 [Metschnikowia bicuspidata var. bicuspidata NRRL YB-4993]OBA24214.1 hypothetical protein METBIDRAFT_30541 [Metschnikowia bicuspidata var. bicuspidata NRRL YB-4993]
MHPVPTDPLADKKRRFSRIRRLTLADAPLAARTLHGSFGTDALASLLTCHITDPEQRHVADRKLYECYVRQHIAKGMCFGIGESAEGFETVAVWSHPTSARDGLDSFANLMEAGYSELWQLSGNEGQEKIFKGMLPLLHDSCERILSNGRFRGKAVYTLVYLGSEEKARGKGNVRTMFEYMFDTYIDVPGNNNIVYLESSSESNIPIYSKFGFEFYEDICLGSRDKPDAEEGVDYAIMNVMIRGTNGESWDIAGDLKHSSAARKILLL